MADAILCNKLDYCNNNYSNYAEEPIEDIQNPDFSDFLWMAEEDLENFDSQVIAEVHQEFHNESVPVEEHLPIEGENVEEQEAFFHEMLAEEEARDTVFFDNEVTGSNDSITEIHQRIGRLNMNGHADSANAEVFSLNPHAPAFVPSDGATNGVTQ